MEMSTTIPKLWLAPMVRIGTLPYRLLALRHGADLVYTEEIIDKKLTNSTRVLNKQLGTIDFIRGKEGALVLRLLEEEKSKLVWQIGSNNPKTALEAAKLIENDVKSIDINMGCPELFSVHGGMGSGLLRKPENALNILKELVDNIKVPISCKIRILPTISETLEFIKKMQSAGIQHLSIHARTREEMSRGFAHWSVIDEAKKDPEITIPINANGDCFCCKDAIEIKKYTNWDSILIARGACHNPAIFQDIKDEWSKFDVEKSMVMINYF